MKILNFGSCNIDTVWNVDHIVNVGETISVHKCETFVGGKGLNQSVAVSKAGGKVYHAGCVGFDGKMLVDFMKEAGVDVSLIKMADTKSGQAMIQVDKNGGNAIFVYSGANFEITKDYVDYVLSHFEKDDILLLQNEINEIDYIVDKAYEREMKIIFNPAPFNENAVKIDLSKLYCIIPNEIESFGYIGTSNYLDFQSFIKNNYPSLRAIITLGKKGSVYIDTDCIVQQKAYPVDAVDTTAAGDTYVGYFVAQLSQGKSVSECMDIASGASAVAVTKNGAAPSVPNISTVIEFIKYCC